MPWDESGDYIRSGHRSPDDFEKDSFRTITISAEEGIKAVIGKSKGKDTTEVQSYLFAKDKDWTVDKAKAWFEKHRESKVREHVSAILPFQILEKIVDKPLRIRGIAMTSGMSRNFNIYTPEEMQAFASKLVAAPVYIEHVSVPNACGKVTKTEWDGQNLWYEAEIYDDEIADKIRNGLIQHVSVGADYEAIDVVDGKLPHGLHNAELSLVAVPGIPETNVQILESLQRAKEQQEFCVFCGKNPVEFWLGCCSGCFEKLPIAESKRQELLEKWRMREQQGVDPLVAGEYILGFYQNPSLFLPEHFRVVWIDQPNGVLALMAKSREDPSKELCQSILFLKSKWQPNTVADWLAIHPDYAVPASVSVIPSTPSGVEKLDEKELGKLVDSKVAEALKKLREAEWDTEYINNLQDSAFAYIALGGEKDEQGKTVPRSLRHLPYKNAGGSMDADHVRNGLARLDQTDISAEGKAEAKKKLCAAAKELNIASEVCGLTDQAEALRKELSETKAKLIEVESKLAEAKKLLEQKPPGLIKDPPKTIPIEEAIGILKGILPSPAVERSTMGMQRECQEIRGAIFKLKERLKSG